MRARGPFDIWIGSDRIENPVGTINNGSVSVPTVLVPPDPRRAVLWLGVRYSGGTSPIAVYPTGVAVASGWQLTSATPMLSFDRWNDGPLAQLGWTGAAITGGQFVTTSWDFLQNPEEMEDSAFGVAQAIPLATRPPPRITTAPGVDGDAGLLAYWRRLLDAIRGK